MGYEIEVDPRVEWAMKVMDQEGVESEKWSLFAPLGLGLAGPTAIATRNLINRYPVRTNWGFALASIPVGFAVGVWIKRWKENMLRENMSTMKHYILTHPERFPEPERRQFKDIIQPWVVQRR